MPERSGQSLNYPGPPLDPTRVTRSRLGAKFTRSAFARARAFTDWLKVTPR